MITYLTQTNIENYWIIDIECDNLTPSVIWCCCLRNLKTDEEHTFFNKEIFNTWNKPEYVYIGHNAISFDIPTINRLWKSNIDLNRVADSLVLSYLYNPALDGGHSLEAWGYRLKSPKIDFHDFSKLSTEMVEYCRQDVRLITKLYKALTTKMLSLGYSEKSAEIEHKIRIVIDEQKEYGFYFDKTRARNFLWQLRKLQSDLSEGIQKLFPPVERLVKEGTFKRNKDGSLPAFLDKARDIHSRVVIGEDTYQYYELEDFNIGSPKQRVERLLNLGWEPTDFTKKGFPQVNEDSLVKFAEICKREEVRSIAEWLVLQGRSSMIETWLNNLGDDSRIHGNVLTCGATTRRCIHSSPNSANIPSGAKAKYGHECRSFWTVEPDKDLVLVGCDASGLETVGLLHYLSDKYRDKAAEIFNQPKPNDVHSMNARKLSEVLKRPIDREWGSKTSFYATIYGAYPPKLATIVKGPVSDGEIVQDVLFNSVPGLRDVIEKSQLEWRTQSGRLRCIDGGYVVCPTISAALNYRIQSLGAVVMKLACIILHEEARKEGLWFKLCGFIHDELQMVTKTKDGDPLGKLAVWSIEQAGKQLNFKVPLTGDYRIGLTWDATH